jgi:hypothetical protein
MLLDAAPTLEAAPLSSATARGRGTGEWQALSPPGVAAAWRALAKVYRPPEHHGAGGSSAAAPPASPLLQPPRALVDALERVTPPTLEAMPRYSLNALCVALLQLGPAAARPAVLAGAAAALARRLAATPPGAVSPRGVGSLVRAANRARFYCPALVGAAAAAAARGALGGPGAACWLLRDLAQLGHRDAALLTQAAERLRLMAPRLEWGQLVAAAYAFCYLDTYHEGLFAALAEEAAAGGRMLAAAPGLRAGDLDDRAAGRRGWAPAAGSGPPAGAAGPAAGVASATEDDGEEPSDEGSSDDADAPHAAPDDWPAAAGGGGGRPDLGLTQLLLVKGERGRGLDRAAAPPADCRRGALPACPGTLLTCARHRPPRPPPPGARMARGRRPPGHPAARASAARVAHVGGQRPVRVRYPVSSGEGPGGGGRAREPPVPAARRARRRRRRGVGARAGAARGAARARARRGRGARRCGGR